jgi:hypothetical protein
LFIPGKPNYLFNASESKLMRGLVLCLLLLILSGCGFGVGFLKPKQAEYSAPNLYLGDTVGSVRNYEFGHTVTENMSMKDLNPPYDKNRVIDLWGKPLKKETLDAENEQWVYISKDTLESGIIIGIGFPIPITSTVKDFDTVLSFSGENLIKATTKAQNYTFCGWFMSDESSNSGCH